MFDLRYARGKDGEAIVARCPLCELNETLGERAEQNFLSKYYFHDCLLLIRLFFLQNSTDEKLQFWKGENASVTRTFCQDLLEKLQIEHLDPIIERVRGPDGAKVRYIDIINGWDKIKTDFVLKAVGAKDVRAEVFFEFNQVNK